VATIDLYHYARTETLDSISDEAWNAEAWANPSFLVRARSLVGEGKVKVSWADKKGQMLREEQSIPLATELIDITGTGNVAPEVGQSIDTAQQQALCRMAEQIVGLMEKPW